MDIQAPLKAMKAAHLPFQLHYVADDQETPVIQPGEVVDVTILDRVAIQEAYLPAQLQMVAGEIMNWGRSLAGCQRALEQAKRGYRQWKAQVMLAERDPDGRAKGWKAPAKTDVENMYRADSRYIEAYEQHNLRIERLAEAVDSAEAVLEGFRAKKEMLKHVVWRDAEGGQARIMI